LDVDEKADYVEVNDLYTDMGLSVEELRRKYYGGGSGDTKNDDNNPEEEEEEEEEDGKMHATKRPRLEEDSDSDCGF